MGTRGERGREGGGEEGRKGGGGGRGRGREREGGRGGGGGGERGGGAKERWKGKWNSLLSNVKCFCCLLSIFMFNI